MAIELNESLFSVVGNRRETCLNRATYEQVYGRHLDEQIFMKNRILLMIPRRRVDYKATRSHWRSQIARRFAIDS